MAATTTRNHLSPRGSRTARRAATALVATALGAGLLVGGAGPSQADATRDALYGMGATVGGSSGPAYYSPAQFYVQTTCTGTTNVVATTVLGSPRNTSGGQWFLTRIWAQDAAGGAWVQYGWRQTWVPETNSMSYSMPDYRTVSTLSFTGGQGRSYRVYVEAYVAVGGQWASIGSKWSNHYTTWGATEPNVYGQVLQQIPGAASPYHCTVL